MTRTRLSAFFAVLVFVLAGFFVATRITSAVDTDILSLLPGDAKDPVLAAALQRANAAASDRMAFAIEGGTAEQRRAAGTALSGLLTETGFFRPSSLDAVDLWKWLFAHRTQLLCTDDRKLLEAGKGGEVAQAAMLQWYAPMGMAGARSLETDPLLLSNRLLGCLVPRSIRMMPDPSAEIISGSISLSAYRLDVQDKIAAAIEEWKSHPEAKGLSLSRAGAVFHAAYGAEQARSEMRVIGGITTIAVLLLYWLMFRSLRAPVIAVLMVLYSLTIGLALTLAIFGSVHAMGLVFGAALIGMVVDYTTYYLVTGLDAPDKTIGQRTGHILKPLTLGMVTSVGAFAALLFFPVPAFRQIAIFGSAGLVAAWLATFLLTPLLEGGAMSKGPGAVWIERTIGRLLARTPDKRMVWLALATCCGLLAAGFLRGDTLDDVRRFQAPSTQLAKEEARIRTLTGFSPSGAFFLVRGASADEATAREENLLARLQRDGLDAKVVWAASRLDPSAARKSADEELVAKRLLAPHLPAFVATLGAGDVNAYEASPGTASLPPFVALLRGETGGVFWSIVPTTGTIGGDVDLAGVQFIEPAKRYSDLLGEYRLLATLGLAGSILLTSLVLLAVYRRFSALRIMLPTVIALAVTPAITSLLGLPFSFFSAMGLFLVVGAGVDYAIFQWEHPKEDGTWTRVGIVLAASMTCISVGLLGLSSVLPVRSFGLTVAIGILLSLISSPLVRGWGYGASLGGEHER